MIRLLTIIGARPQIIKAAAISRAIRAHFAGQIEEHILHTGQHYDDNMSEVFFRELGIPSPDYNLHVGSGSHGVQTARIIEGIEEVLMSEGVSELGNEGTHGFDGVIVYGDTNSTLAAAVAAAKIHVPVFHIEAGLRSFNMAMPEEQNRIVCDALSSILFAPTRSAVENLEREGFMVGTKTQINPFGDKQEKYNENTESSTDTDRILTSINQQPVNEQDSLLTSAQSCSTDIVAQSLSDDSAKNIKNIISDADNHPYEERRFANGKTQHVVLSGDVMYDNSMYFSAMADQKSDILERLGLSPRNFVLATIHRPANTDNEANLRSILRALSDIAEKDNIDVILPLHPRTKKRMSELGLSELVNERVRIIEPVSFFEIIRLEKNARVVMTDSGGVQKEAFFYGTPCVILRPETEWVEIVEAGAGILADADYARIMEAYKALSDREVKFPPLFGDGKASEKMLREIIEYLK